MNCNDHFGWNKKQEKRKLVEILENKAQKERWNMIHILTKKKERKEGKNHEKKVEKMK